MFVQLARPIQPEPLLKYALLQSGCDLTLAITGVAGPRPYEDGNPVGLFYVAAAMSDGKEMRSSDPRGTLARDLNAKRLTLCCDHPCYFCFCTSFRFLR